MKRLTAKKVIVWIVISAMILFVTLGTLIWAITFHPAEVQAETVTCTENAPVLQSGQSFKVMTYNIQYLAGKNHFFWYEGGDDERPSAEDIEQSAALIAQIIQEEDPDIILLQEVDDGSKRTDYQDQLAVLRQRLPDDYRCHASAFYWKAAYVPHPKVRGAIGDKLSVISKYQIRQATRYQLPLTPADPLTQQFSPKRAILEARLPVDGSQDFILLTTHLEVADRGAQIMQRQVAEVDERLQRLNQAGHTWLIGGDFNLLPPGQHNRISAIQQAGFRPKTELKPLFDAYQVVPGLANINANERQWLTMNLNDPSLSGPDYTLDYIFYADNLALVYGFVRQDEAALAASDHLPLIAEFRLP